MFSLLKISSPRILLSLLVILFLIFSAVPTQAQEAQDQKTFSNVLLENVFLLTIIFIFLSAIITAILGTRARDRCLKNFNDYPVLLHVDKDNKLFWGKMKIYSTGFVVEYDGERKDRKGHLESSFILYKEEWGNIAGIYRFVDILDTEQRKKRVRDVKKTSNPSIFRRAGRWLKNLFNTIRDAVSRSIGLVIGQMKKAAPYSHVLSSQDAALTQIGKSVVDYGAASFDPMLESLIGKNVVVETERYGEEIEVSGILKEYSVGFLHVMNVISPVEFQIPFRISELPEHYRNLVIKKTGKGLKISNTGKKNLKMLEINGEGFNYRIEHAFEAHAEIEIPLEGEIPETLTMKIREQGEMDMILARPRASVRHRGEIRERGWKSLLGLSSSEKGE